MELWDSGQALRAKLELARRHAEELTNLSREQRERALAQRRRESGAAAADDPAMYCAHCNALWRRDEVGKADPRCLICDGPLVDLEPG